MQRAAVLCTFSIRFIWSFKWGLQMGAAYSSLGLTKVLYATSLVFLCKSQVPAKETKCLSCWCSVVNRALLLFYRYSAHLQIYKCSFTVTEYIYLYSYLSNVCPLVNLIAKSAFYNTFNFVNLYEPLSWMFSKRKRLKAKSSLFCYWPATKTNWNIKFFHDASLVIVLCTSE